MKNFKKGFTRTLSGSKVSGFTLIELLVVVAIIGILASVVLASLNSARSKGANAAVKKSLKGLQTQAALYFNDNGNYGAVATFQCNLNNGVVTSGHAFFGNSKILSLINSAVKASSPSGVGCNSSGSAFIVSVPLKINEGTNTTWCIDSNGASKATPSIAGDTGVVCPP